MAVVGSLLGILWSNVLPLALWGPEKLWADPKCTFPLRFKYSEGYFVLGSNKVGED